MVGPGLGIETTLRGRSHDLPGKRNETGCRRHIRKEDVSAVEEAKFAEMEGNGFRTHFGDACHEALVSSMIRTAWELERDMPGFGHHTAEAVAI